MARGNLVTPEMATKMKRMKKRGRTIQEIADKFGMDRSTISMHVNDGILERRREYQKQRREELKAAQEGRSAVGYVTSKKIDEDWQRLRAEIPKRDNRDLTGRVFGDPLPERSALAQREAGQ